MRSTGLSENEARFRVSFLEEYSRDCLVINHPRVEKEKLTKTSLCYRKGKREGGRKLSRLYKFL